MGPQGDSSQPFDPRFMVFMLLSVSILLFSNRFLTPPPVEPAANVAEGEAVTADPLAAAPAPILTPPADKEVAPDAPLAPMPLTPMEAEEAAGPQRLAIGSVDPKSAYRMLVTLDNVGAAVERVELSSPNYRDLEDRSGYLGQLALSDAPTGGAVVNLVGAGTPAAEAGLEQGDVIVSVTLSGKKEDDSQAKQATITTASDLSKLLGKAKPKRKLKIELRRDGMPRTVTATLRRQPLDLIRPEIENIRLHTSKPPVDYESQPSFVVRLKNVGGRTVADPLIAAANEQLARGTWTVEKSSAKAVSFRKSLPELGLTVLKQFSLVKTPADQLKNKAHPSYHFHLGVQIQNQGKTPQAVAYELTGPNGLPIEGYWYANKIGRGWGGYGLRDVVVRYAGDRFTQIACSSIAKGKVDPMGQGKPLAFVGVDAQYFASILIPEKPSLTKVRFSEVRAELATAELDSKKNPRRHWENASFVLARNVAIVAPGAMLNDGYKVFAGPKLPALLRAYQANDDPMHALDSVLYYGWFGPVAKVMLGILHFFKSIVGNYGIAILMLTVVVRASMFPISRKQALNMVKMQELKPEMDRIVEKYKTDMQKRSQAQQELFRKHNYNPAAGCLPMFLQLPIFLGLYRALAVDVELRQASLFGDAIRFCSNLASPDMFYDWSAMMPHWVNVGQGMLGLGPYFNLLPLLTIALFLLQQKMFMPEPTNDQARMQQQMMKYVMGFMGLLFFKVPSGLCLYFIASSLWGITERKMLPKPPAVDTQTIEPESLVKRSKAKPAKKRSKSKKGGKRKR